MVALANNTSWYVGSTKYSAMTAWAAGASVSAGALRRPTAAAAGNERAFVAIVGGTTHASTEPTWTNTKGAKTTDNTVTWQEVTGQPAVNGDSTNTPAWGSNLTTTLGQIIYDPVTQSYQIVSTAGTTTNGSAPSFSATAGTTTTDNSTTWTSLGLASNFAAWGAPHARLRNAFTSTWGASGDTFAVSNNHAATEAAAVSLTPPGTPAAPNLIVCVNDATVPYTSASLATTATESTTGANNFNWVSGFAYTYGLGLLSGSSSNTASIILASSGSTTAGFTFESCTFTLNNTSASSVLGLSDATTAGAKTINLINPTIVFGAAGQNIHTGYCRASITGGSIAATGTVPTTVFTSAGPGCDNFVVKDCDLSACSGNLLTASTPQPFRLILQNCKLHASHTSTTGTIPNLSSAEFQMWNSDSGNTNYNRKLVNYAATITTETSTVLSGGNSDGTTPTSYKVVTTANAKTLAPLAMKPFALWNDTTGSSKTVKIELTSSVSLTNNDVFIDVEYLGDSSSPKGSVVSTRATLLASATTLTTSSATWTNGQANTYKIEASFTPQQKGLVIVTVYVGKASTTVYIDPRPVIS